MKKLLIINTFLAFCFAFDVSAQECNTTINAGEDQSICTPGEQVSLNADINGSFLSLIWSPTDLVADSLLISTTATVNTTTTFELTVFALSETNLITNGDFSNGDTGFTSDYIYGTGGGVGLLSDFGQYAIADDAGDTHNHFDHCSDHTGGGNMMVVNGSGEPNNVWCQEVSINPNTDYAFSAWVTSVVSQNPAKLQFSINGALLGNLFQASPVTCSWNEFSEFWNSGTQTSAEICVVNVNQTPAGNDFAIDDISFQEVCEITDQMTVEVLDLSAEWNTPGSICQNEAAFDLNTLLTNEATPGGVWTIDGNAATMFEPIALAEGDHNVIYTVNQDPCSTENSQIINIIPAPNPGIANLPAESCSNELSVINLESLLEGEDTGGNWTETSAIPSAGNAFNGNNGTFNTQGQLPGEYNFQYTFPTTGPCPEVSSTISVVVLEAPIADAGEDQTLGCGLNIVSIGGANTSIGASITYNWTALNGSIISNPNTGLTEVDQADTYTLTVTNNANGCFARDEVFVSSDIANFNISTVVKPISCYDYNDGSIAIGSIDGGTAPYLYSLNGADYTAFAQFNDLYAGDYELNIKDDNNCDTSLLFTLQQPPGFDIAILTDLNGDPSTLALGTSVNLELQTSLSEDQINSITWEPEIAYCPGCLSLSLAPTETNIFTVTVTNMEGCSEKDSITILVTLEKNIFIPNAFSPNADGFNDIFFIHAGEGTLQVNNFLLFDRWGNKVYENSDFPPNNPTHGWNGKINGEIAGPGLYVYFAEIEMKDGRKIIEKGGVALMR